MQRLLVAGFLSKNWYRCIYSVIFWLGLKKLEVGQVQYSFIQRANHLKAMRNCTKTWNKAAHSELELCDNFQSPSGLRELLGLSNSSAVSQGWSFYTTRNLPLLTSCYILPHNSTCGNIRIWKIQGNSYLPQSEPIFNFKKSTPITTMWQRNRWHW